MWTASSDPVDFDEAIAWFRRRVVVSKAEFQRMSAAAKRKAFAVANVAQLDLVNHVWSAIDDAIKTGKSLEDFKKAIGPQLKSAWQGSVSDPGWRLETIFRTNVLTAYSAGRYKQATHPDVVGDRPVWMFDAILDGRTTDICRRCDSTKRPASDGWWQTHTPPLHHNCRSHFITLTDAQSQRSGGITLSPPATQADDGFGVAPSDDEWEPDKSKYPQQLWLPFVTKQAAAPPPPPPSKFVAGTHAQVVDVRRGVSKKAVDETFKSVTDAGLLQLLKQLPVARLTLAKTAGRGVNGWFNSASGELRVAFDRASSTFGQAFTPGVSWSMSKTAPTREEAVRRTFLHELGHHVHLGARSAAIDAIVSNAFKAGTARVTKYASVNDKEYFAESFAAYYIDRAALRRHDPVGLKMVEDVLRVRGVAP